MAANLAIRLAVQWVAWVLSAGMTIFLLPFLLLFWAWSLLTDYSDTVKHKSESSTKGWRISRGWGNSRFVQLKVSNTIDIHLKNILFLNFGPVIAHLISSIVPCIRMSAFIISRPATDHDR